MPQLTPVVLLSSLIKTIILVEDSTGFGLAK